MFIYTYMIYLQQLSHQKCLNIKKKYRRFVNCFSLILKNRNLFRKLFYPAIQKPSLGSCEVPQKLWAGSV